MNNNKYTNHIGSECVYAFVDWNVASIQFPKVDRIQAALMLYVLINTAKSGKGNRLRTAIA